MTLPAFGFDQWTSKNAFSYPELNLHLDKVFILMLGFLNLANLTAKNAGIGQVAQTDLNGHWIISKVSTSPLAIQPNCKNIPLRTCFKFLTSKLEIYPELASTPCDMYTYRLHGRTISFIKDDMVWLCTFTLESKTLKIRSQTFFSGPEPAAFPGQQIIRRPEIEITLIPKIIQ